MGFEFTRPLLLVLLPVGIAGVWLIDRFAGRDRRSLKRSVARILRTVMVALLVLALCGPALLLPGKQAATWVLWDTSASTRHLQGTLSEAVQAGLMEAPSDLQIGVVSFGKDAMVDMPLAAGRTKLPPAASTNAEATNISSALTLAQALLPEDAAGRIVLLSDGKDTGDGLSQELAALSARGIAVDVLPFPEEVAQDAQVTSVTPPAQARQGESFDVVVRLDATRETTGTLVLSANRQPVDTREITLRSGENTFIFQDIAQQSGIVTYEAQWIGSGDENPYNDKQSAYMDVRGASQVLVAGDGEELAKMLRATGMEVETLLPGQLPQTVEGLRPYHAIALVNVNDDDLSDAALEALDAAVRQLGRGLAVFGGDDSYAPGGWRGSALEAMLPVTMDVDNRLHMPSLALVLVIDKSGSMTEGRFGVTRLEVAKEAAMRSTEVLTARDQVGVIAFDDSAKWAVPIQQVEDVAAIQEMIGTIRPGGGTAFYGALSQSLEALSATDAQLKHVIFLTDGDSADSGYEQLVQQMASLGITLTTVAVGGGANTRLLANLAELGGGRAYATDEFDDIPKVFTKETYLATQAYVQNRTFHPVIWSQGPLTHFNGFPQLHGYLSTTARPLATVALVSDREEPLLAWWQYGAGRSLAWTSDTRGAWTSDLLAWEEAAAFFAGMLTHVIPTEAGEGELALSRTEDRLTLRYTIENAETGLTTEAMVLAPDGTQETLPLVAAAPGVYEGTLDAAQQGAYAVQISQRQGDGALVRTLESGLTVGYSQEYDLRATGGGALLTEIASATGGRVLDNPAGMFTERGVQTRSRQDITTPLLILALVLFVLDAAQRRLSWERWLPQGKEEPAGKKAPSAKTLKVSQAKTAPTEEPPAETPRDTAETLLERRKKKLL